MRALAAGNDVGRVAGLTAGRTFFSKTAYQTSIK